MRRALDPRRSRRPGIRARNAARLERRTRSRLSLRDVIEQTFPHISVPAARKRRTAAPVVKPRDQRASRGTASSADLERTSSPRLSERRRCASATSPRTGAMIEIAAPGSRRRRAAARARRGSSISATVEWAVGDQVGLSFHSPFDMNLLADIAARQWRRATGLRPAYLKRERRADAGTAGAVSVWRSCSDELEGFISD